MRAIMAFMFEKQFGRLVAALSSDPTDFSVINASC
jgi:hypothetical protein